MAVEFISLLILAANGIVLYRHAYVMEFTGFALWLTLISATVITMTAVIMLFQRIRRWTR